MMMLHDLLVGFADVNDNVEITGITADSRDVKSGDVFVAFPGLQVDGREFIEDAIKKGANAVICESGYDKPCDIPLYQVAHLQPLVGEIAARFFQHPSRAMVVIGITGTNGKTSCSHFIASALEALGKRCAVVGTIGCGFLGRLNDTGHTTPDAITLQRELAMLREQGAEYVAMEVSSHALEQQRIAGVQMHTAVFTNLSRDHLDYHGDMGSYGNAKKQLFLLPGLQHAVINADDEFVQAELLSLLVPITTFSLKAAADITASQYTLTDSGFSAQVSIGSGELICSLLGEFNLSNVLATLAALKTLGFSDDQLLQSCSSIATVPGRLEALKSRGKPLVVIDYAHTPDALAKALQSLRQHTRGQLWCVFGCGGDRDHGKRPLMAATAERYSDQLVITDDNPRSENPEAIVDDMMAGLLCPWAVQVVHDRHAAIAQAISCAQASDTVLIAGKGHETYQLLGGEKLPFNDMEEAKLQLELTAKHASTR